LTKRVIVKKNGGGSEDFEDLSKKINVIKVNTGVDITYVSVSQFLDKQELLIRGDLSATNSFVHQLEDAGLLIMEELLIPC